MSEPANPEMEARDMLRSMFRCVEPHGCLEDFLEGDATLTEMMEVTAPTPTTAEVKG